MKESEIENELEKALRGSWKRKRERSVVISGFGMTRERLSDGCRHNVRRKS